MHTQNNRRDSDNGEDSVSPKTIHSHQITARLCASKVHRGLRKCEQILAPLYRPVHDLLRGHHLVDQSQGRRVSTGTDETAQRSEGHRR